MTINLKETYMISTLGKSSLSILAMATYIQAVSLSNEVEVEASLEGKELSTI
jgi:hypothetical protein